MAAKSYKRIAATIKSIEILEFLSEQKGPVAGADIAAGMNMAYDTVMCHLATLADVQCVDIRGDHYELGSKMSYFWARYRARLKSQINKRTQEYQDLEV